MKLTFTDKAKARLEKLAGDNKKLVLDFDDGVGPFSNEANCTLALSFNLLFVPNDTDLSEFGATFDSNMGTIHAKPYSLEQMDEEMTVDVNEKYLRYTLSGRGGVLDPALGIKTL
ncbi:iron-sulfur cluster biosynthesis family protein [Fructobacillus sp. M1-13]|uniref:Iron-sulfur cluster biosynthesis family protein n=1 Tax=Fructobacillus papyriferae TaxID=2713171 RepID=A0ABS5QPN6_9LACO|nr:iron-sulfur cluster biosynthesis family protein [Fructobacillus papyriferae]MBS9335149.1 iron-sulfur cluster biosynthesis family protein [Fructobacillus papyriferae]MCD2159181.1 iron-sulfur cluster biosynthesis family protein [Fructobacillus papyriferae]